MHLMNFENRRVYSPDGKVDVTPQQAEAINADTTIRELAHWQTAPADMMAYYDTSKGIVTGTRKDKPMKFRYNKFGLAVDPRRAHVTLRWQGRTLLGEVVDVARDEVCGVIRLVVRHFNGEPWPIQPAANAVNVLERK